MTIGTATPTTTTTTCGTKFAFEAINEAGCYVCNETGHLFRIRNGWFDNSTENNWFEINGNDTFWMTFICNDPSCDTDEVRNMATNCGVNCNF